MAICDSTPGETNLENYCDNAVGIFFFFFLFKLLILHGSIVNNVVSFRSTAE